MSGLEALARMWRPGAIAMAAALPTLVGASLASAQEPIPVEPGAGVVSPEIDPSAPSSPPGGQEPIPPADREKPLVAIDPGHGGRDSGAVGRLPDGTITGMPERRRRGAPVIYEKDVNLDVAKRLEGWLAGRGYGTLMTRTQDLGGGDQPYRGARADLSARVRIANAARADLFVSIHANALTTRSSGTETYRFYASSPKATRLARQVQRQLVAALGLPDRGVKSAGFYVLRNTRMPAILVESAFLSNPREAALLARPDVRQRIAGAIGTGIALHVANEPGAPARPRYWVTAGRLRTKKLADRRAARAKALGFDDAVVRGRRLHTRKVAFHVRVGEFVALAEAKAKRLELIDAGLPGRITSARPTPKVATGRARG